MLLCTNILSVDPMSTGGGSKRLFRKVNNRSSEFYPNCHEIRREGSYIYEEFLVTQGTDVKVYALGPNYGHAEARKSPVVDGRVQRDSTGLEVRYPVILSIAEKEISRKITEAFKQTVCGFDILRVQGKKSYVCDVNGWSFVKNSRKYYDDASQVLSEFIASKLRPDFEGPLVILPAREVKTVGKKKEKQTDTAMESEIVRQNRATLDICDPDEELVCVVGVMRHGDRTPKQKLKVMSTHQKYLDFFHHYAKSTTKELKVKTRASLLHFLATTVEILQEYKHNDASYHTQLDYYRVLRQIRDVLERFEISGINRKLQMKPAKWTVDTDPITGKQTKKASELLLIMKWGGDLTPLGRDQAESLGAEFRQFMYPDAAGGGVLRLHSTYRHDLKIKSSDEGRVMKTGAAFAKGLLELEGSLTPILASLVTVEEKGSAMLDKGGNTTVKEDMDRYHHHLNLLQLLDSEMNDEMVEKIAPECSSSVKAALFRLGNPRQALRKMYRLMEVMIDQLEELCVEYEAEDEEDAFLHSRIQTPFKVPTPDIIVSDSGPGSGPTAVVAVPGSTNAPSTPLVNRKASLSDAAPSNSMFCSLHNDSPSAQSRPNSTASRPSSATSRASISSKPFAFPNNTNAISGSSPPRQTATTSNSSQDASDKESTTKPKLYLGETHSLRRDRWEKIHNDFYDYDTDQFELTKVPGKKN